MYAIEFETDITDRFIEIVDFEKLANRHVKVIILAEEYSGAKNTPAITSKVISARFGHNDSFSGRMDSVDMIFDKFQIDFTDFKFDREEANAR